MVRHLNMHFDTKQYRCNICEFSFARAISLRKHLLIHNEPNTKSFSCSKCSKVFVSNKHLKIHKKSHVSSTLKLLEGEGDATDSIAISPLLCR